MLRQPAQQRVILLSIAVDQNMCWKEGVYVFVIVMEAGLVLCQFAGVCWNRYQHFTAYLEYVIMLLYFLYYRNQL